MHKGYYTTT